MLDIYTAQVKIEWVIKKCIFAQAQGTFTIIEYQGKSF